MRTVIVILCLSIGLFETGLCQKKMPKNYGEIEVKLFSSDNGRSSLVVAFGGSEGGNTFANEHTADAVSYTHLTLPTTSRV